MISDTQTPLIVVDVDYWLGKEDLKDLEDSVNLLLKASTHVSQGEKGEKIKKINFKLLSSRGYITENEFSTKLNSLTRQSSEEIKPEHIILSYTPIKKLLSELSEQIILIAGANDVSNLLPSLEITRYVTTDEYALMIPDIFTANYRFPTQTEVAETRAKLSKRLNVTDEEMAKGLKVGAIFIWGNHYNWEESLGIICDHLGSEDGTIPDSLPSQGPAKHAPVYIINNDFIDVEDLSLTRFGCGALVLALDPVYKKMYSRDFDPIHLHKSSSKFLDYLADHAEGNDVYYLTKNEVESKNEKVKIINPNKTSQGSLITSLSSVINL